MAFDRNRDFVDVADEALARRDARLVTLVGVLASLVLGIALVSVLMYGRILTDEVGIASTSPAAVVAFDAPKLDTP